MGMTGIFIGGDGRLRSGWRFVVFLVSFILAAVVLQTAIVLVIGVIPEPSASLTTIFLVAQGLALLIPGLLIGWLCTKFLDGRPISSTGASFTGGWLRNFGLGVGLGGLTLSLAVGVAALCGGLSFAGNDADLSSVGQTMMLSFVVFLVFAAWEETVFRGYPMQTFFHSKLAGTGVVLTSIIFATIHVGNPRADLLSWLNTFLAGIWFAAAYWRSRDLWLPFGMHLMWNWMQGAFFGIEVSGLTNVTSAPLLREIDRGPAWLTGEAYGIEAGIAATVALMVSTLVILILPAKTPPAPAD